MKFGESLRDGLVPEWKDQYVDYREGKEIIKKCVELKGKFGSDNDEAKTRSNERTPLLEPADAVGQGYTYGDMDPMSLSKNHEITEVPNRKTSIFNYSLKTPKNKNKNDDYATEKEEFQKWLDSELLKVNEFYQEKEQEAYERFLLIQDQLYQLRDHKAYVALKRQKSQPLPPENDVEKVKVQVSKVARIPKRIIDYLNHFETPSLPSTTFLNKLKHKEIINNIIPLEYDHNYGENQIRNGMNSEYDEGTESEELEENQCISPSQSAAIPQITPETDAQRKQIRKADYIVRKQKFQVPYIVAKKNLREAVLEHYRALSLLRSYRVLNRTALRKVTKKFDKSVNTAISKSFMKKIDESAYFQTSDLLDKLTNHVEDLYVVFFDTETEDRKHSMEKLKSIAYAMNNSDIRQSEYYTSFGTALLCIGFGLPLFILAVYTALSKTINGTLPEGKFLIQVWAGFFLVNLIMLLFGINLMVFDHYKINYKFIFEFDLANALNWRQYLVLPSMGFALFSILFWFSFNNFWPTQFAGRDWPWIFFGVTVTVIIWPGNQFYASSRKWLQVALWRLLLSGFYPVEFRDFFLGDILCSLTYTMGNISFFFCLYANNWNGLYDGSPSPRVNNVCGSSKSRSMGFFSALPTVFRFLQCLRRYMDTGDWFPHLANMLKYTISTIYYAMLSAYRIERIRRYKIVFMVFGVINSLYSATWDIFMDWSLLQSGSKHKYLRNNLFYKRPGYYYFAIVSDILLRFLWVFYACFNDQIEQLAVTSFCIAFAEIIRRFIWIFFRMENEHATNTILFRASKDSPLPYRVSNEVERAIKKLVKIRYVTDEDVEVSSFSDTIAGDEGSDAPRPYATSHKSNKSQKSHKSRKSRKSKQSGDQEAADGAPLDRRKSTIFNISDVLNKAHIKDFQRKIAVYVQNSDDDDEEDEEEEGLEGGLSTQSSPKVSTGRQRAGTLTKRHGSIRPSS